MTETSPNNILEANLAQLARVEPELAERLRQTAPADLRWTESKAGPLTAAYHADTTEVQLASRYDPIAEATKLTETVDHGRHACVIVLGAALGYHVAQLADHVDQRSLMIVYEPNSALLRAVLERIDHTNWLGKPSIILADDTLDRAALLARIEQFSGMLAMGTTLLTHPASRRLSEPKLNEFSAMVTEALAFCRTNVATAMVNASRTYRNLSMCLGHYAAGPGTDDLVNAARNRPAVCVGAGPSLARNAALLADPDVRDKVVVISAQTTLKPLLDRGIRPDFVTALDYHAISKRFYENLPNLDDITLVAEPMVNPAVIDAYPGPVRLTQHNFLDRLLGDQARPTVPIQYGASVAHLSFYLAQHLGCDPIILIGQDMGFSDGLYYCPGTAIHDVWAPELGPFNTLEMMEWQRIVRHRGHLQQLQDIHDKPIYTDEQMVTYLKQFERDFAKATQTILDATEGGLPKQHTVATTLKTALARHATVPVPPLPIPERAMDPARITAAAARLEERINETDELRTLSRKTLPLLKEMRRHQRDPNRMRRLFARVEPMQRRVDELKQTFNLVNELNAVGAFNRARSDRAIENTHTDTFETQRQRLDRDIENVDWLAQACEEALDIFRDALKRTKQLNEPRTPAQPTQPEPAELAA